MEPGRPVGGAYYLYRTLRQLDAEGLVAKMMAQAQQDQQIGEGAFDERLAQEDFEGRLKVLKELIEAEIRRRLVADRGVEAMARTLRKPLPEDVDFMHASREEMQQLQTRDLPAHARAGRAARAAPPAPAPRHARLPPDHPPLDGVRRHPGRAEVQAARSPRSPRSWSSPTSAARWRRSRGSRCSSSTRCRASSRRSARGCSSTASTRSRASSTRPTTSAMRSSA